MWRLSSAGGGRALLFRETPSAAAATMSNSVASRVSCRVIAFLCRCITRDTIRQKAALSHGSLRGREGARSSVSWVRLHNFHSTLLSLCLPLLPSPLSHSSSSLPLFLLFRVDKVEKVVEWIKLRASPLTRADNVLLRILDTAISSCATFYGISSPVVVRKLREISERFKLQAVTRRILAKCPRSFSNREISGGISEDLVYVREPKSITCGADTRNVLADASRRPAMNRDTVWIVLRTCLTLKFLSDENFHVENAKRDRMPSAYLYVSLLVFQTWNKVYYLA